MAARVSPARVVDSVGCGVVEGVGAARLVVWPPRPGSDAGECSDASPLLGRLRHNCI